MLCFNEKDFNFDISYFCYCFFSCIVTNISDVGSKCYCSATVIFNIYLIRCNLLLLQMKNEKTLHDKIIYILPVFHENIIDEGL